MVVGTNAHPSRARTACLAALWALCLLWLAGCAEGSSPAGQGGEDNSANSGDNNRNNSDNSNNLDDNSGDNSLNNADNSDNNNADDNSANSAEPDAGPDAEPDGGDNNDDGKCEQDDQCEDGELCVDGNCVAGDCRQDADCPSLGQTCVERRCTPNRPPEVARFDLDAQEGAPGEERLLSWEVRWADELEIVADRAEFGVGAVEPTGEARVAPEVDVRWTLRASNAAGTVERELSLDVTAPLALLTPAQDGELWALTVGVPWEQPLRAQGGEPPLSWSVEGDLPEGVTFDAQGERLLGTPTRAGEATITVTVEDGAAQRASRSALLRVSAPPLQILTESLPNGVQGAPYRVTLEATGGAGDNSWSLLSGDLPQGITLSAAGALEGEPTALGLSRFSVQVEDAQGQSARKDLQLEVTPPPLTFITEALPEGRVGEPYEAIFQASGGAAPYRWILSGRLPRGVVLNQGALRGTPSETFEGSLIVQLRDAADQELVRTLALRVLPARLGVTTQALPDGRVGQTYAAQLTAANGAAPYSWSAQGLPEGLECTPQGRIQGVPVGFGAAQVTVTVQDSNGATATAGYGLRVLAEPVEITTTSLPEGRVGEPYAASLQASGGTPPLVWSALAALPDGLTLSPEGLLGGTPTQNGSFSVRVRAADAQGQQDDANLSVVIAPQVPTLGVQTTSLPLGTAGQFYSASLQASGGAPPYVWSLVAGEAAEGVSLGPDGALAGTPQEGGEFSLRVQVNDSDGGSAQADLSLSVRLPELQITTTALPVGQAGQPYSATLQAQGSEPRTWAVTGGFLPDGLALAPDGALNGTPTAAAEATFEVTATGRYGEQDSATLSLLVNPAPVTVQPQYVGLVSSFVDISGASGAVMLDISDDDDSVTGALDLPFVFRFYGQDHAQLYVSSNGFLSFSPTSPNSYNSQLGPTSALKDGVAAFWDDLDPGDAGEVYMLTTGTAPLRRTIIQWKDVDFFSGDNARLNFEIVLYESTHQIQLIYGPSTNGTAASNSVTGADATIGLADPTGDRTVALAHAQDNAVAPGQVWLLTPAGEGYELDGWSASFGDFSSIRATGTLVPAINNDDTSAQIPIGFNFNFFGADQTQVYVTSNGLLSFPNTALTTFSNASIPSATGPQGFIAPFWDDLHPRADGQVHHQTLGTAPWRQLVVQWSNFHPLLDNASSLNFQVVLHETSNAISVHYGLMRYSNLFSIDGSSATVGLENPDGSAGVQLSFDQARVKPGDGAWLWPRRSNDTTSYAGAGLASRFDDVTLEGRRSTASDGDDTFEEVDLGFDFPFYGQTYARAAISSNGFLMLGSNTGATYTYGDPFPEGFSPNGVIAPFWDDLDPTGDNNRGSIWTLTTGEAPNRAFIVQWQDVPRYANTTQSTTFQAVLHESGEVELRYGAMLKGATDDHDGRSSAVGLESPDGARGTTFAHNQARAVRGGGEVLLWPIQLAQ